MPTENKKGKDKILDAARIIVEESGTSALTYKALQLKTGMSKGGVLYHFQSREALVREVNSHLAFKWEAEIKGEAQNHNDVYSVFRAYSRNLIEKTSSAEIKLLVEVNNNELFEIWDSTVGKYAPPLPEGEDEAAKRLFIARLLMTGVWCHQIMRKQLLPQDMRDNILDFIDKEMLIFS